MKNKEIIILFILLATITLISPYQGSVDAEGFLSVSKFFAKELPAKIRSSEFYTWGFANSFHVFFFKSFIGYKIMNLLVLFLVIYSVYYILGRSKKAFLLMLLSPVVWYMAPWASSIPISTLFFIWSYYFINKYDLSNNIRELVLSGIFLGFSMTVWHGMVYLSVFYILFFFYDKKLLDLILFFISVFIGLMPLFLLDYFVFGFPFHSFLKNNFGTLSNFFGLGVYSFTKTGGSFGLYLSYAIIFFLMIPFYFWKLYNPEFFKKNHKTMLFLTVWLILSFFMPRVKYIFLFVPIIIIILFKNLNKDQYKKLLVFSAIVSFIVVLPYLVQIIYSTNSPELFSLVKNFPNYEFDLDKEKVIFREDLHKIASDYPGQIFIVGNEPDDYGTLAVLYWGDQIKEFVSIQDYKLYLDNTNILVEREFRYPPNINEKRREIWIKGGIGKPLDDPTDYESIKYAISLEDDLDLKGFKLIKKYKILKLFKKMEL